MEKSMISEQIYNRKGMRFLISAAALVLILWGVNQAQSVISLLLISGFLAIIGIPPYFWLIKKRFPSSIAVLMVIAAMILVFLIIDFLIGLSIKNIIDSLPVYQVRLQEQLIKLKTITAEMGLAIDDKALLKYVSPEKLSSMGADLLSGLITIISSTVLILLTVSFVLLEATSFPKKLRTTIGDPKALFPEFSKFVNDIKRYVLIQTVVSLATGIIAGVWLALLGVDFAVLFGLITFLFNYIPNVGSIIAITPAVIVTFIQFGIERALIVFVGYLIITLVTGSIIVPRIMGQRLGLSNLVVFLSLIFWGSLLGIIGMVLCVPLTMALKFVLERSENTRWIAALLGRASKKENIQTQKSGK
jgi:predicted PurR-regulated permease PerM